MLKRFALIALVTLGTLPAQDFRATLQGRVTDPSGKSIVGARVVIASMDRDASIETLTNDAGRFTLPYLSPGGYRLTIEKPGFKKFVRDGILLAASAQIELDARLELGSISEAITVSGLLPLVESESASRGGAIENRILDNVPSGGRNLFALEYSVPGVAKTSTYWGSMELYATSNVNNVQLGGGRNEENETLLDGLADTRSDRGIAYVPPLASVDELVVHTNAYDAQFGRTGGGIASINLKSGTDQFHGQLYDFLKNDKLRANDWIANKNNQPNEPFKNNTFGAEVAGPLLLPKVYRQRNRLFFLLTYEGLREHSAGGSVRTLPSEAMKAGDFSALRNDSGQPVTIYDPQTVALQPGGQYARLPFPGNMIPKSRIDPVAAKVIGFYPQANLPGDGPSQANNYSKVLPATNSYDAWLGKVDLYATSKSRVAFRYGQTPWSNFSSLVFGDSAAEPSSNYPSTRVQRNWGADSVYLFAPSLTLDLRAGLARYEGSTGNSFGAGFDPRALGFPSPLVSQFTTLEFPRFTLGTYSELGASGVTSYEAHDTWSLLPILNWTRGRHRIRAGFEFRTYNNNMRQPGTADGTFAFDKGWTQANPLRADSNSGNEVASFLLGLPASGSVPLNIDPAFQNRYYAGFLADDFKVSRRLTLNYGLRWEYETPYEERYDRMINGFALDQLSPIASQVSGLALRGGLTFAGINGSSRYAFDPKPFNFDPRVGVAYRLGEKWVLRGGYGVMELGQSSSGPQSGFSRTTSMITSLDGNITPAASLSNPFPASLFPTGLLRPIGSSQGLATNLGQSVTAPFRDRPLPYSHQYSFGIETELPGSWLLDVAYQGNLTRRLPVNLALNFIPLATLNSIPVDQRTAYFTALVPNPMAGLLPGTSLNAATIPRQQLTFAYPQYSQVTLTDVPIGKQRYDSLQLKLTHRFSRGLALTIAFTAPKTLEQVSVLNAQDVNLSNLLGTTLEKRLAQFDVSHQTSIIGTYDLPFGKGRQFLSHSNSPVSAIAGGWTFSGFFMSHSGFPLDFPNAAPLTNRSAALSDAQRDALAQKQGRSQYDVSYDKWYDVTLFPSVAGPAPFTLRTFPTRFPDVRSKPLNIADISLYKEFSVTEKLRAQIRADAHNVGNFPWFGSGLSNSVTNAGFGQLKADMGNEVRTVVLVAKLIF